MEVLTNMAGNVWKINVSKGDKVSYGQEVSYFGIDENGNTQ